MYRDLIRDLAPHRALSGRQGFPFATLAAMRPAMQKLQGGY
jgi:hypothetical protein